MTNSNPVTFTRIKNDTNHAEQYYSSQEYHAFEEAENNFDYFA